MRAIIAALLLATGAEAEPSPIELRVNYRENSFPNHMVAVEGARPIDFSWGFLPELRGSNQSMFHLVVTTHHTFSQPYILCDTGPVASSSTLCVQACPGLSSAPPFTVAYWKLATAGPDGAFGMWVEGKPFVLGGGAEDFVGGFLAAPPAVVPPCAPARLRGVTQPLGAETSQALERVVAFIASPGYWQLWSNDLRIDQFKAHGAWPDFTQRSYYDAYDLTPLFLNPGAWSSGVPLGFRLGPGTYCDVQFAQSYNATAVPLLLQIHAELVNGTRIVFASGGSGGSGALPLPLRAHADTVVAVDWHEGETVHNDMAAALAGWDSLGFDDSQWAPAVPYDGLAGRALTPALLNPAGTVTHPGRLPAAGFWDLGNGSYSWSFPSNFAGFVEVTVNASGFKNSTLRLFGGELTDGKGAVINQLHVNLQVFWRLAGLTAEIISPTFVFFGAQYFGVDGWPAGMPPPTLASAMAVPTSTLWLDTGLLSLTFGSSSSSSSSSSRSDRSQAGGNAGTVNTTLLAGIQAAILQSQRSNFQALPSDCPNREKRGWMGDGAVSAWQAAVNFDVAAPYRSWTLSMLDDQARVRQAYPPALGGDVSSIVPAGDWPLLTADAAWGAAIGEVPYQMLREYGDVSWAVRMYPGARAYFHYLCSRTDNATGLMTSEAQWGDWDAAFPRALYQPNTMHIGATAAHVRLAMQLLEVAPLVGQTRDAPEYEAFLSAVRAPFNAVYANASAPWTYSDGVEQTPTLLALSLGLVPPTLLNASIAWLINDIESTRGVHLSTGATGTRLLFAYLSSIGRTDLAVAVAAQDTFPSHGFWIAQGATTCWENWSGETDAQHGNVPPTHNHIFLGSHSGWMWESLVGVGQPKGSYGYARVAVRPPLLPGLLEAMSGELESMRGPISVAWAGAVGGPAALNASLPVNMAGTISVPVAGLANVVVTEGGTQVWRQGTFVPGVAGVYGATLEGAFVTFSVGSGEFAFIAAPSVSASASSSSSSSSGAAPTGCSGAVLTCAAPGARIAAVRRAGLAAATGASGAPWARRFLLAHIVEAACLGRESCAVPSAREVAAALVPAVTLREEEAALPVCVEALCA